MLTDKEKALQSNMLTLTHAVELTESVIMEIAGEDISNTIDGKLVRPQDLADAVTANIQSEFSKYMGAV